MSRRLQVLVIPAEHFPAVLRGEMRLTNVPHDARIEAAQVVGRDVGLRIVSERYEPVLPCAQIPKMIGTLARTLKED